MTRVAAWVAVLVAVLGTVLALQPAAAARLEVSAAPLQTWTQAVSPSPEALVAETDVPEATPATTASTPDPQAPGVPPPATPLPEDGAAAPGPPAPPAGSVTAPPEAPSEAPSEPSVEPSVELPAAPSVAAQVAETAPLD